VGAKILRLDRDLEHIKIDITNLSEKHQRILSIVQERTATQCAEKLQWEEKRSKIQAEIAALQARIELLQQDDKECIEKLNVVRSSVKKKKRQNGSANSSSLIAETLTGD